MASFPISKSFLATEALAAHLAAAYGLTNVRCQLLSATLRDVYLVRTSQQRLVCYVYRAGLRSPAQIVAEW